ncbi:hypothetical protein QE152_g35993 [Popillia japonica]|uniref:Integrase zinc-binding domain-containing protein n=1 Tax=Popillia japonica TaxID=7064 RepID=A0AAW1IEJ8_POPJA
MNKVAPAIESNISRIQYWTDSTIVLAWLNTTGRQLKTFVANRTTEIQDTTDVSNWFHIGTRENPADLLSRGVLPQDLLQSNLWWHGPAWLANPYSSWPHSDIKLEEIDVPEQRSIAINSHPVIYKFDVFDKFSNLLRLQRVISYCKRFIHNSLCHVRQTPQLIAAGPLTTSELHTTMRLLIKSAQGECFSADIHRLSTNRDINPQSSLKTLHPFLDSEGIVRVGGRLKNSQCTYDEMHPIILPKNHHLTKLLIEHTHQMELHAGTQATLAKIRNKGIQGVTVKSVDEFKVGDMTGSDHFPLECVFEGVTVKRYTSARKEVSCWSERGIQRYRENLGKVRFGEVVSIDQLMECVRKAVCRKERRDGVKPGCEYRSANGVCEESSMQEREEGRGETGVHRCTI